MKYILSAAALTAAAAAIGIFAGTASADQPPQQQPSAEAIEAKRAQARRNIAAAQICGGSAWEMQGAVLTCFKETGQ